MESNTMNRQNYEVTIKIIFINRIWCKVTLRELPFGQEYCTDNKLKKKALCIELIYHVYTLLTQNGCDSYSALQATFDYPSFNN
ncbi:hypothetical protein Glove_15g13 [Diversispora epigaea]|uniref:Uncharacterized protein n=1 Tax=Diversispora epigaea TaxID=1348612 RepID=A0A397JVV5_9GLOM|nr:hypothetical protein Glove_15g13 [Diversispora epigaea]